METEEMPPAAATDGKTFKIASSKYPEEFDLDKTVCKQYFRQFGKVKRMIFKQKQRVIVVEYTNEQNYFECLAHGGDYEGQIFIVEPFESNAPQIPPVKVQPDSLKKKHREKIVNKHKVTYINPEDMTRKQNVSYVDNDEVSKELAAMSGYSNIKVVIDLTSEQVSKPKPKRAPKLNRVWKKEDAVKTEKKSPDKPKKVVTVRKKLLPTTVKKKAKEKTQILTSEQLELLKIIRSQAHSVEDKHKILDARDKLLRVNMKKSKLKSGPTVGTCPDMCPEKERLLREIQHQVSMYEQYEGGKHSMDPSRAVKRYSRSSADQESPLSHELRPVNVLQITMNYLMHTIMDLCEKGSDVNVGEWFHFLWDRTRGIRKDITQQNLCCQGSVELVEQCARFHIHCSARLMGEDPSVFDQKINTENLTKCLQTLKYMYHDLELKGEKCPNEPECRAYIILLNLSDGNFMWEVQNLRLELQKSPEIKFALQIYSAFEKRNYIKFFKLIKSTTYLNACILMRYFVQVRVQAIETLVKCFTPPKSISFYPIQQLTDLLFFDDVETAVDFMRTYGIGVNKDKMHFLIERVSFRAPEFPYALERSRCVESKREGTVGIVVNGKELSPEMYMQIQSHEVYNSFDKDGFLIQDEIFNEIELRIEERLLDEVDSRESTPERKSIVSNIFAQKTQPNTSLRQNVSPNIFSQTKEEQNMLVQTKSDPANIFVQWKTEPPVAPTKIGPTNIFTQTKVEPMDVKQDTNFFSPAAQKELSNIFRPKDEGGRFKSNEDVNIFKAKENFFAPAVGSEVAKDPGNIFVFRKAPNEGQDGVNSQNIFAKPSAANIFATDLQKSELKSDAVFDLSRTASVPDVSENIFAKKEPPRTVAESKKGGFTFVLNRSQKSTEVPNIFAQRFNPISESEELEREQRETNEDELRILELERHRLQEEIKRETEKEDREKREQEEIKRQNEEIRRRNEEAAEKRRLETERRKQEEIDRKKREEEERIQMEKRLEKERRERERRLEKERIRREEEMKRKQEELERQRKEMEERRKEMEIQNAVKSVVSKMVEAVDLKIRQETLKRIRENIRRRSMIRICKKWRSTVVKRMKKRKAMDCSPVWFNTKNVEECAKELHTKSQDLALSYMKRYKQGRPLDIPLVEDQPISQLNLFHLTYSALRRRLCELKEKWHQHIYWKVVISIPDIDEMINGLYRLEETLKSYTGWQKDKYGNSVYIEEHKTATYCVEKQQGFDVRSSDANAFVFVAKNFNSLMQRRIYENLKNFGVYVKLPIVLVLEDTTNSEIYLQNLRDTGVVSDYIIYSCNLSSEVLPSIIDNGMIFLAKRVEKNPPLEMDTLFSFLSKNLCTEIWKKAGSYAKWNHEYNFCMRDPNVVINLHNEGVDLLGKIITDRKCKEYAVFPEAFKDYLPDKVPDFLPCDYKYFPSFWITEKYENKLKSVLKKLKLPKFLEKWPPENETELILNVSKYCAQVFGNPKETFLTLLNNLKEGIEDFYDRIMWTEAIQIIAKEKLKELDVKLPRKQFFDEIFDSLIVVYNVNVLNEYSSTEWFYRNNPLVEGYKKIISDKVEEEKEEQRTQKALHKRKRTLDVTLESEDVLEVISKAENVLRSSKTSCLENNSRMQFLNKSLQDLEESIRIVKRMDEMRLLRRFIES